MLLAFMFAVNIYGLESFSSVRNSCFRDPAPYFDLGGNQTLQESFRGSCCRVSVIGYIAETFQAEDIDC